METAVLERPAGARIRPAGSSESAFRLGVSGRAAFRSCESAFWIRPAGGGRIVGKSSSPGRRCKFSEGRMEAWGAERRRLFSGRQVAASRARPPEPSITMRSMTLGQMPSEPSTAGAFAAARPGRHWLHAVPCTRVPSVTVAAHSGRAPGPRRIQPLHGVMQGTNLCDFPRFAGGGLGLCFEAL